MGAATDNALKSVVPATAVSPETVFLLSENPLNPQLCKCETDPFLQRAYSVCTVCTA